MDSEVVGRAELKLAETVLDIGSSTGGVTELALRKGAKRVVAVEIGTKQMKVPLRFDPRIDLREKTDIFTVSRESLPEIDTAVADVSFVSLTKVLSWAAETLDPEVDYLVMLKPQFEAFPDQLVKGVVKNEKMRREIIRRFEGWLAKNEFVVRAKRDNETLGKVGGNRERFYFLKRSRS